MHPRSYHNLPYDLETLVTYVPVLKQYITLTRSGGQTIDFSEPKAVMALNKALLLKHYDLTDWSIPEGYLCPPIPGRAEYLHLIADELAKGNAKPPYGKNVVCLDVGVGANCVYPIIGTKVYGWQFIGVDVDKKALESASAIISRNERLTDIIDLRHQTHSGHIFNNIWKENEYIDVVICNPPFHSSQKEAEKTTKRKLKHVTKKAQPLLVRNFGGKGGELWYPGGEKAFLKQMISESTALGRSCYLFSCLVSSEKNIDYLKDMLKDKKATHIDIVKLDIGNKRSRVLTWSFLSEKQKSVWRKARWTIHH